MQNKAMSISIVHFRDMGMDIQRIGYHVPDFGKTFSRYPTQDIGSAYIRLCPRSFITDIELSVHAPVHVA
jgi:hypothetical protein